MRESDPVEVDPPDGDATNEVPEDRIEPGEPSVEGVAFVLLGALATLYVIARIAGLV